jgi:diaminopimelate epimerase
VTAEAWKLSGGGNDFIGLAEPAREPTPERIRAWCTRRVSVGADGVFIIARREGGVAMRHYNADGGVAELCVNGTRCAARLALELGWAETEVTVFTDSGPIVAHRGEGESIRLDLEPPAEPPRQMELEVEGHVWQGWFLNLGVPHFVLAEGTEGRSLEGAPVAEVGPRIRSHPRLGGAGANVDFVRFLSPHRFEIRTWERGVEGETLACGSGVLAGAAVGLEVLGCESPVSALTAGGFRIGVEAAVRSGRVVAWSVYGDARLIGELRIRDGAAALPEPARWAP